MISSESSPLLESEIPGSGPGDVTSSNKVGILAGIWTATFLASINTTLVATLLTSISSEFNSANESTWIGVSYLIATATFTPLYGRLCNVIGRRGANQLALVLLGIGTMGCGLSSSMRWLIVFRFVAGCGGGGIFTTASIITSDLYSMRERSLTQGIASIFSGMGMGLGGPIGGWVSDRIGWRWAFLIQFPLFFISFFLTQSQLRYTTPSKARTPLAILLSIDYLGSIALLITLSLSLFSISNYYNSDIPFSSPQVWACALGAVFGAITFLYVELMVAEEPVLESSLLLMRVPLLVGINSFLVPLCNFSIMYFFPMWFEIVAGKSSSEAGLHLLPNAVAMSLGSLFAGYMMHKTGKYKTLNLVFGILPFVAACLIIRLKRDSGVLTQWLSNIPLGFGNAVVLQTTLIALLVAIPPSQLAVGTRFVQLYRGIGQVFGVAIPSAFFQRILQTELRKRLTGEGAEKLIQEIRHNSRVVKDLPEELQSEAREAFAIAFRAVFIFGAVCTLSAFIVRLGIPEQSLDVNSTPPPSSGDSDSDGDEEEEEEGDESTIVSASLLPPPVTSSTSALESTISTTSILTSTSTSPSRPKPFRRLSTYSTDYAIDPEPNTNILLENERVGSIGRNSFIGSSSGRRNVSGSYNSIGGGGGRGAGFGGRAVSSRSLAEDDEV